MFVRKLFYGLLYCIFFLLGCSHSSSAPQEKPNILFISVDDLNDWVGFLDGAPPGSNIKTPNLDRLARSSLAFTNAHTAAPACAPSRVALMTGVHSVNIGVENEYWGDGQVWRKNKELKDVETLGEFFHNRGYKTLGGGKLWHTQAPPWDLRNQIEPKSWDYYYPSKYAAMPYQQMAPEDVLYPDSAWNEKKAHSRMQLWGPQSIGDKKMADFHTTEWASHELSQEHDKPFFMAVGLWKPHVPWSVPQKYFDMYPLSKMNRPSHKKNDLIDALDHERRDGWKWILQNQQWKPIIQAYKASITFADKMVGRLLDALEESRYSDNTIIVLWSDHGMHLGEKENIGKFTLWEEATRVLLIIKYPGVTEPGSKYNQPVSLMDIYPTLADVAGFDIPSHVDGISLVPMLKDQDIKHRPVVTGYEFSNTNGYAVRSERYRYIYYPQEGLEELYDHKTDPNEWNNIAYKEENENIIQQHRQVLSERFPDLNLKWGKGVPDGYSVMEDGTIRNENFIPIEQLQE